MTTIYKAMFMSFDGDYKIEGEFKTVNNAWEYASNIGSKWYFYPFCFVVTSTTIIDTPLHLHMFKGKRIKTVSKIFKTYSELPENKNADCDDLINSLREQYLQPA